MTDDSKSPIVVIVGGGPTGLAAAMTFEAYGADWRLFESGAQCGGLSQSIVQDGFTWDLGGHVGFSRSRAYNLLMDDLLGAESWIWHDRRAAALVGGQTVAYPVQHNEDQLPDQAATEGDQPHADPASFEGWMRRQFSARVIEQFLLPYNRKLWNIEPAAMSSVWVGDRVAKSNDGSDESWGPNRRFRYPARGGTGAPWSALASRLPSARISNGVAFEELDTRLRTVKMSDGSACSYDVLISTIPLTTLIDRTPSLASLSLGGAIENTSVGLCGFGFRGSPPPVLSDLDWLYCAEPELDCYRLTVLSRYSPHNAPPGHWSLLCESGGADGFVPQPAEGLLRALGERGLCDPSVLATTWTHYLRHGYPIPTLQRDAVLRDVHTRLEHEHVFSRGRFGGWRYEVSNQDHSFLQGSEVAHRIMRGLPETTLWAAG